MHMHEYRKYGSMYEAITSIGILVANDDQASQNTVAEVLRCCNYEVLHTGTAYDSLHALWENKDRLDIVITNAQKLKSEGLAIIQHIEQKLKLKILLIDNDERIEPKGEAFSFSAYALNGLSVKCFNDLLENARRMEGDKMAAENVERASFSSAAVGTNKASSSINDAERLNQKHKAVELYRERSEDSREDHLKPKKQRITWTNEMHQNFLVAVERLGGHENAFPKKIVEVMGDPTLSRENVASHLQTINEKDLYHKPYCQILPLMSMPHNHIPLSSSLNSSFNKDSLILLQKYRGSMRSTRNELEGLGDLTSPMVSRLASLQMNLAAPPQSSYIHTFKESKLHYMSTSTSKDLSFGSLLGRRFYTTMGASRLSDDRSGVDKLRNMTQCRDESSSSSKFVGYRFKGSEIGYGPIKKINTDALFSTQGRSENQSTSYVQHHPISDQNLVGSAGCILQQSCLPVSRIHGTEAAAINTSQEPDVLSSYAPNLEEDTLQQMSVQLSWETTANATTSSMFPPHPHQDLSLPVLEATGSDFTEQSPAAFIDDILQQHCSPPLPQMFQDLDEIFNQSGNDDDDTLTNEIGNSCDQFDFPELDETFFSRDD